jgi:hypothetical protein
MRKPVSNCIYATGTPAGRSLRTPMCLAFDSARELEILWPELKSLKASQPYDFSFGTSCSCQPMGMPRPYCSRSAATTPLPT